MKKLEDINLNKVAVASCGGNAEADFTSRLSNASVKSVKNAPEFVFRDYLSTHNPVLVLQLALVAYKDATLPLILLISRNFLQSIWATASKGQILKTILSYSTKYCLHIWFDDLTESDVEKYSSGLCRSDSAFRRISYSDLPRNDDDMIDKIISLMKETSEKISFENFSVQDTYTFEKTDGPKSLTEISASNYVIPGDEISQKNKKKEAHSMPTNASGSSNGGGSSNKKKKKANKKAIGGNVYVKAAANIDPRSFSASPIFALKDVLHTDKNRLASMLDVGYGANWKQIAAYYELLPTEINNIEVARGTDEGPTEKLFKILLTRIPNLDLEDLKDKCRKIARTDVADEIDRIMKRGGK